MGGRIHFDAFNPLRTPLALKDAAGRAVFTSGLSRRLIDSPTGANNERLLVVQGGGHYLVGQAVQNVGGTITYPYAEWTMAAAGFNATGDEDTGPVTSLTARCSMRIYNYTKRADVGGIVRVLRIPASVSELTFPDTASDFGAMRDLIRSHVLTRTYSGHDLLRGIQVNSLPCDYTYFNAFHSPRSTSADFQKACEFAGLTTLLVLFESVGSNPANSYEVVIAADYYNRYNFAGPLANMARVVPSTTHSIFDRAVKGAESVMHKFVDDAGGALALRGAVAIGGLM